MAAEKEKMILDERKRIKVENEKAHENTLAAADIVLQNKLIMEAQQRKEFELKQAADTLRLEEIQKKVGDDGWREEREIIECPEILHSFLALTLTLTHSHSHAHTNPHPHSHYHFLSHSHSHL